MFHTAARCLGFAFGLGLLLAMPDADAQETISETRTLGPAAQVEVHNVKGSIEIVGGNGPELRLSGSLGSEATLKLSDERPDRLKIEIEYPNRSGWGWGGASGGDTRLRVELPKDARLQVSAVSASIDIRGMAGRELAAESVSGSVSVRDSAPDRLAASTVSGSLLIESAAAELVLESVSGEIEAKALAAQSLRAETVSGAIDIGLQQPARELRLETVSGRVSLQGGPAESGSLRAETLSGRLRVVLPAATSAKIRAESFSGRIRSAVGEVEREEFGPGSSLRTEIGSGSADIRLETFSGELELRIEGR